MLIAVLSDVDCEEYSTAEMKNLEAICVRFPLSKGNLFVYCLYIQTDASSDMYEAHINAISSLQTSNDDIVIIAGDFNLPGVKWIENEDGFDFLPVVGDSSSEKAIIF